MAYGNSGLGYGWAVKPEYRTQKARGLKALQDGSFFTPTFEVYGIESFRKDADENGQLKLFPFMNPEALKALVGRFVRPCPMVPRHGFVDSRPVHTLEDAEKIIAETYAVEDKAEFIIMPFLESQYSAIWTDGQLVIGTGNDGATSGKASRSIPALGFPTHDRDDWERALLAGSITESPYVEMLWSKAYTYKKAYYNYFVQLRNGPKLPSTVDYIPAEITVSNVVLADGDLLEWETKARAFTPGTVVHHPGGSLASHYAVHAVLHGTPVLISREPKIGEVLTPTVEVQKPDAAKIQAGFYLGATADVTPQEAARVMLVGCHSTSVFLGKSDTLLGLALGCAYRLIITAALGEVRHAPGRKRKPSRNAVYTRAWGKILNPSTRTRYLKALHSFEYDAWRGSYGGHKWLDFARYAGLLYNAVLDGNVTASLELLNQAVHAAHNSGWAFDKFIPSKELDETAKNPTVTMLKVAPFLYEATVKGEDSTIGTSFFSGRHHYELEPGDETGAAKDDERDVADDCESEGCGECGEHGCESCYPDGCVYSQCDVCNPEEDEDGNKLPESSEPGEVISAQVKLTKNSNGQEVMHVQYKAANIQTGGKKYWTKDVTLPTCPGGATADELRKVLFTKPKVSSMNDGKSGYTALRKAAAGHWYLQTNILWTVAL